MQLEISVSEPSLRSPSVQVFARDLACSLARGVTFLAFAACIVGSLSLLGRVAAQDQAPAAAPPAVRVPSFWDPRRRPERPDLSRVSVIRFLTETDYPPFNFTGPDGNPQGFNVDLARLICDEIKVTCTIQMRRFDTLLEIGRAHV